MARKSNNKEYTDETTGKKKISYRIGLFMAMLLLACAGLLDWLDIGLTALFGAGLVLNTFEAVVENIVFWIWLLALGVPYTTSIWRFIIGIISLGVELTPAVNNLPAFTVGIFLIILITRHEDKHNTDFSILTLADPRNLVSRASRKTVSDTTSKSVTRAKRSGKDVAQERSKQLQTGRLGRMSERYGYAPKKTGRGFNADGSQFEVNYSLDKKETFKKMSSEYSKGKVASNVEKERYDGDGFYDAKPKSEPKKDA